MNQLQDCVYCYGLVLEELGVGRAAQTHPVVWQLSGTAQDKQDLQPAVK